MNGAEALVRTLSASDVDVCFANPGTSEMHFVSALDRWDAIRCVLGLTESVVTGAADGYARIAGKPAATMLHCGPGLANGLANLHNARRANSPIVNIVGDQATYHRRYDPPLTAATEEWARPVSVWTRTVETAHAVSPAAREAIAAARGAPGGVATLILPSDVCWDECGFRGPTTAIVAPPVRVDENKVAEIAAILASGEPTAILVGGAALYGPALQRAAAIAEYFQAKFFAPSQIARMERGRGRPRPERLPFVLDQAIAALAGIRHLVLVGAISPVAFFAYPGKPATPLPEGAAVHVLARPDEDLDDALARLADRARASAKATPSSFPKVPTAPRSAVTADSVADAVASLLPDQAIVVDESVSFGRGFYGRLHDAAPHDWLQLTGGAIGSGIPMATGAAIAAPGRRVVNLQADGSALYTVQGLWTQAHERLDVTTIILANRKYQILLGELKNVGASIGKSALDMLTLDDPAVNWVKTAQSFGVEAARATSIRRLSSLMAYANSRSGPFLIELLI